MSDYDSSSSDDLPLARLGTKDESSDEAEAEFDDEEDDGEEEEAGGDEPDSDDFIVEDSEADDDDDGDYETDSSDDAPLTSLKSNKTTPPPKKAKEASKKPAKKTSSAKKKAAPKKKSSSAKKKKKSSAADAKKTPSTSASNYLCASGELYAQCDKGKLIQHLLARWWYAYEWPDPKSYQESTPPGYDALDGFPGLYICTQGSEVGKILDRRDHTKSPCFKNFAKKDSVELKDLLLRAIEDQLKELVEHEGKGTVTEKNLRVLEGWAMKLNCAKADKEAVKVLKAKRLTLS